MGAEDWLNGITVPEGKLVPVGAVVKDILTEPVFAERVILFPAFIRETPPAPATDMAPLLSIVTPDPALTAPIWLPAGEIKWL